MGEDKKAPPDLTGLSRDGDRKVLEQLIAHGDDLSRRRHTLLYFIRDEDDDKPADAAFDEIVARAAALGLSMSSRSDYVLALEGQKFVDPENIEALSTWAQELADEMRVEFDGWECAVDPGPLEN
jgi:hypothetical protein